MFMLTALIAVTVAVAGASFATAANDAMEKPSGDAMEKQPATTITLRSSKFGRMLFDSRKQAIYIFENDRPKKSVCYGACAEAWPPVLTSSKPKAAGGARKSLLGTTRRRDRKLQVTYAGKPLYYYAHERPGQVLCHNVDANGGFWWVVGAEASAGRSDRALAVVSALRRLGRERLDVSGDPSA